MRTILSHAGLAAYCARNPADGERERHGDSISWIFDGEYRISCELASGGDLLLEARVIELPQDQRLADETLAEAMQCLAFRVHEHAEALVLSENEDILLIQQTVAADADVDAFESSLERFINALANWRQAFFPG